MSVRNDLLNDIAKALCDIADYDGTTTEGTAARNGAYLTIDNAIDKWAGGKGENVWMSRKDCLQHIADNLDDIAEAGVPGLTGIIERTITDIEIPDEVTKIGKYAFSECDDLETVVLPSTVTLIDSSAFSNCDALSSVTIPDGLETIGSSAFTACTSLTKIVIPDSVTSIGPQAFRGCTALADIELGNGIEIIGVNAFQGADSSGTITCHFAKGSIGDAPWGFPVTIVYDSVTVEPESQDASLFETAVSDIQSGVAVADGAITGTLKFLDTGAIPAVWGDGNFMALKFTNDNADEISDVKIGMDPSQGSGMVALDEEMNAVIKVTDKDTQVFKVQYKLRGETITDVYDLSGLTVLDS